MLSATASFTATIDAAAMIRLERAQQCRQLSRLACGVKQYEQKSKREPS